MTTKLLFYYFIFPGFAFLALGGMVVSWIDRKLTARLQYRVGPVFFQPFYDLRKLIVKETILPSSGSIWLFVISPVIAVLSIMLVSDIVLLSWFIPRSGFNGDLIVVFYLLTLPAISSILGASASNNPLASLGASRELKMILSYEIPLVLSILVAVLKSGSITLSNIISYQASNGPIAASLSGFLALIISLICLQAKLGLVPFDLGESETELSGGCQIDYSGPLLGLWKLAKMMLTVAAPIFLITLFWAGGNWLILALKYLALIIVTILIRNTNPRLRVDTAVRFFWGIVTLSSILIILLAWMGL